MVDVAEDQREGPAAALEFVAAGGHLVVEGPAIRQTGEDVSAGFGGLHFHQPRLFVEFVLHGADLRLHRLVGLDQPRHGRDHALGVRRLADGQFLVDRFHAAAVLADVGGHVAGQVFEPREDFLGQALFFRQFRRSAAEGAMQRPAGPRSAGGHHDRNHQVAKHRKHNSIRFPVLSGILRMRGKTQW